MITIKLKLYTTHITSHHNMHPNVHNTNISLPHPIITYRSSYTQHADKACQTSKLAHKYHYGLFKTQSCLDKKIKSKLIQKTKEKILRFKEVF